MLTVRCLFPYKNTQCGQLDIQSGLQGKAWVTDVDVRFTEAQTAVCPSSPCSDPSSPFPPPVPPRLPPCLFLFLPLCSQLFRFPAPILLLTSIQSVSCSLPNGTCPVTARGFLGAVCSHTVLGGRGSPAHRLQR